MKKRLLIFMLIFSTLIISKYFLSSYSLEYKINNHDVKEIYKNDRIYFEIDNKYNFDVYMKRKLRKKLITSIDDIEGEGFFCIYPFVKEVNTYPLCIKDNNQIDYHMIDGELLDKYKEEKVEIDKGASNFNYYNSLDNSTYVALWNYKGYTVMNGNLYKNIEIFEKDRYDNSLSYIIGSIIYMPDYDEEHEFDRLITLDMTNNKRNVIDLDYTIDYDSYVVGNIKNNIYVFDNKHSILYEINIKKKKTTIKSSNEIGYVKYVDGEFITCSKSEYKVDRIKYNSNESIYKYYFDGYLYKSINDNKNIKTVIHSKDVSMIKEHENKLYYIDEDYLYRYDPYSDYEKIFYFFELNFNKNNTIFIYNK